MLHLIKHQKNKNRQAASEEKPDLNAFDKVYERFRIPIMKYVFRKVGDVDTAEEVTQDVFMKVYQFRHTFDPSLEFSTWLWTIAKNTISDWFRKNGQSALLNDEADRLELDAQSVPSPRPNPEIKLIEASDREKLIRMTDLLTDLQKKALMMRLIYQLPYQEIARQLQISRSAVKCLIHRAKENLTKSWTEGNLFEVPPYNS